MNGPLLLITDEHRHLAQITTHGKMVVLPGMGHSTSHSQRETVLSVSPCLSLSYSEGALTTGLDLKLILCSARSAILSQS